MSVVRVDVRRGESFFVEFHNLTDSFRVSITDFDKPDVEDVQKKGRVVGGGTNQLYQEYERDYDSWHYISVLPESVCLLVLSCQSTIKTTFVDDGGIQIQNQRVHEILLLLENFTQGVGFCLQSISLRTGLTHVLVLGVAG
jgi:hypothetical protein